MELINRSEALENLQPMLDLFELGITPKDVLGFRWVPSGESVGIWHDALEVVTFSYDLEGKKSGTVTHTRMITPR